MKNHKLVGLKCLLHSKNKLKINIKINSICYDINHNSYYDL